VIARGDLGWTREGKRCGEKVRGEAGVRVSPKCDAVETYMFPIAGGEATKKTSLALLGGVTEGRVVLRGQRTQKQAKRGSTCRKEEMNTNGNKRGCFLAKRITG